MESENPGLSLALQDLPSVPADNITPQTTITYPDEVKILESKLNINEWNLFGETSLHVAVKHDMHGFVKFLHSCGADVNFTNEEGNAPLHLAVGAHNCPMVCLLVHLGADVEVRDKNGNTPLIIAAAGNNLAMTAELLNFGADVEAKNNYWNRPLMVACYNVPNRLSSLEPLLCQYGVDVHSRDQDNRTPLHFAAAANNYVAIRKLLQHGAVTEAKDSHGLTPLMMAAPITRRITCYI